MLRACQRLAGLGCIVWLLLSATFTSVAQDRELTVWVLHEERNREYRHVINMFNAEHPDIFVNLQLMSGAQADFMDQLVLSIVAGAPPDLTWVEGSAVIEFAANELLRDVTEALAEYRFTPSDAAEMTFGGRMYGAPYHTTSRGLFKRIDLFEQAGLDPYADPGTLETLEEWNKHLIVRTDDARFQQVGFIPWGSNWGLPAWMWAFGGDLIIEENGTIRPTATHPNNVRALEWMRQYVTRFEGQWAPVPIGWTSFVSGALAMEANSSSMVGRFLSEGVPFTTSRVPHPPEGRNGTWGGGQAIAIPVNARNPDDATLLMQFFSKPSVQAARFEAFPDALPANWDAIVQVAPTLPPEYGPLLDQLPEARPRTPLWLEYYTRLLRPAERSVVEGVMTAEQALENVQRVMEARYFELFGS